MTKLLIRHLFITIVLLVVSSVQANNLDITADEQAWITAHPVIRISVDTGYGPYTFLDDEGHFQGVAAEFLTFVEQHLGIRFEIISSLSWTQQMQAIKQRKLDVVATVVKLPEREAFIEFSKIYLFTPLVIMTRNETPKLLSFKQLNQLSITLVEGYSSSKQLLTLFPDLQPHYVTTPLQGLSAVASGASDAYVGVLGVNSFLAAKNGITNLKVNAAFDMAENGQRFGVRKDWPQLARLLDKALTVMSAEHKNNILQRWLPYHNDNIKRLTQPGHLTILFPWLLAGLMLILSGYIISLVWSHQLKKKLASSESRYQKLFNLAAIGISETDTNTGRLLRVNQYYCDMLGYTVKEMLMLNYQDFSHADDRQEDLDNLARLVTGDITEYSLEKRYYHKNGQIVWIKLNITPFWEPGEPPTRHIAVIENISSRKHAEQESLVAQQQTQKLLTEAEIARRTLLSVIEDERAAQEGLRRSQKMDAIGQMAGGIAHDFNNILGVIIGNLSFLKRLVAGNEAALKRVNTADKAAQRAADLTKQLLGFSRQQAQQVQPTDINQVIQKMDNLISRSVTPEVEIELHFTENLWLTEIDPADLEDALLNLVLNARDIMSGGGKLTIETSNKVLDSAYAKLNPSARAGEYIELVVSDTGKGISKSDLDHIFEPFFTTKPSGKGTGLGLSMVFGFIQRSKGHIKVYSESDIGTTFRCYLPRSTSQADIEQLPTSDQHQLPRGNETILVVDDEPDLLELAQHYLEELGYTILTASNGHQALEVLSGENSIKLLFSDIVMPGGLNGYELAEQALALQPKLKVLLTSGYTNKKVELNARGAFKAHLLHKPYLQIDVANRVRGLLDK